MKKILFTFFICLLCFSFYGYEYEEYDNYDAIGQENIMSMQQKNDNAPLIHIEQVEETTTDSSESTIDSATMLFEGKKKAFTFQNIQSLRKERDKKNRANVIESKEEILLQGEQVEDILFQMITNAYEQKNIFRFNKLIGTFEQLFPLSRFNQFVEAYKETFYLFKNLAPEANNEYTTLEIDLPPFQSIDAMAFYLNEMKKIGVDRIIINPFQLDNRQMFAFAKKLNYGGAYFRTKFVPYKNDILKEILKVTLQLQMKVVVKLPMRTHPWLSLSDDSIMMEQSYSYLNKKNAYRGRLSFFHPEALNYLKSIVDDLLKYEIEGIILHDDYGYHILEGNSSFVEKLYQREENRIFTMPQYDTIYDIDAPSESFNFLKEEVYQDHYQFLKWKSHKIHFLLSELIGYIKRSGKNVTTGITVSPVLFDSYFKNLYFFAQSGTQIINLPVDFFYYNWKHNVERGVKSDMAKYLDVYQRIERDKQDHQAIWLKQQIEPNQIDILTNIQRGQELIDELNLIDSYNLVIGPINRSNAQLFTIGGER